MSTLKTYTLESAPEASKDAFQASIDKFGAELNIFADMAESPAPINLYLAGQDILERDGTLSEQEINLAQMAVSIENGCEFCVPAHTFGAKNNGTDDAVVAAVRDGVNGPDESVNALVNFTRAVVRERGHVRDSAELTAFFEAGYTPAQVFEVISIVAYKTITNYTSAIQGTKPNDFLAEFEWHKNESAKKAA